MKNHIIISTFFCTLLQHSNFLSSQNKKDTRTTHQPYKLLSIKSTSNTPVSTSIQKAFVTRSLLQSAPPTAQQLPPSPYFQVLFNSVNQATSCLSWRGSERQITLWDICLNFNRDLTFDQATRELRRSTKFAQLEELLKNITLEELNAFDEKGQTLAHRITPLGDAALYLFLMRKGLDITVKSKEQGDYKDSNIAHTLAAQYRSALKRGCHKQAKNYETCLELVQLYHPRLFTEKAKNGKTPLFILQKTTFNP
ncbi:hypothetical protein HYV11_03630 [Candidatus Dependentiae bacterium]|nr:hypothetical protein [Candidatus Dependentiae bacterium]